MGQEQSFVADDENKVAHQKVKQRANLKDIVVVSSKAQEKQKQLLDKDLEKINSIKLSRPILQNMNGELDYTGIPRLSSGPLTEMVLRYQFHLTECAEAVSFDQNVLSKRIKELDSLTSNVYKIMNERHKTIDHIISQIQKVMEVSTMLDKIETNLNQAMQKVINLNKQLPVADQICDPEYQEKN